MPDAPVSAPPALALTAVSTSTGARRISRVGAALLILYFTLVFQGLEFSGAGVMERDGYYHARYSQMLPEFGLSRSFPWMDAARFRDNWCDKDFLYHVFLAPFCQDPVDPIIGAQWATVLLFALTLALSYVIAERLGMRFPVLLPAILGAGGALWWLRMLMVRSHVISVLFLMAAMALAYAEVAGRLKRAWLWIGILGFLYAWSYSMPPLLLWVVGAAAIGRYIGGGGLEWKTTLAAAVSVGLGLIVHPYSPATLETLFTHVHVALTGMGMQQTAHASGVGTEFHPLPFVEGFLRSETIVAVLVVLCALFAFQAWRRKQLRPATVAALCVALCALALNFRFTRFAEYNIPAWALTAGMVWTDRFRDLDLGELYRAQKLKAAAVLVACVALIAGLNWWTVYELQPVMAKQPPVAFRGAARWMEKNLEPNEVVLNFWWSDWPELYYTSQRQRYTVGLDPQFLDRYHPERSRI
ncbi:MAG TPA: hypothetical protein VEJ63_20725, partial [Planctomycetota bacterium]|nr:hypothetical protein [Planctomycetota bacterium]